MNYWYAPVDDASGRVTQTPPELIAAVSAPWRSTTELEAIKAKAVRKSHYDLANAAQSLLISRKQQLSSNATRTLLEFQGLQAQQQEGTAEAALFTVDSIWAAHLEQLKGQAADAVRALQERHEEALAKLRIDQVARAQERGIRPQRRSREVLNLRRSESVLAKEENYAAAFQVKAHADVLSAVEASEAHKDWLLKCHGEQEKLLLRQQREVEALCKRLDERLHDVELARERDLEKLKRKIKVVSEQQRHDFVMERQHLQSALAGCMLNTRTTRAGRGLADAFPTMARMATAGQAKAEVATTPRAQQPAPSEARTPSGHSKPSQPDSSAYLMPNSSEEGGAGLRQWREGGQQQQQQQQQQQPAEAPGVRFAPTPRREAWAVGSEKGSGSAKCVVSGGGGKGGNLGSMRSGSSASASSSRPSSSSSSSSSGSGNSSNSGCSGARSGRTGSPHGLAGWGSRAGEGVAGGAEQRANSPGVEKGPGVPSSVAVGSGTTGKGSGSSALTEEALRAMNQAMGAPAAKPPRGPKSAQTSSFRSNVPYAGGMSVRAVGRPVSVLHL